MSEKFIRDFLMLWSTIDPVGTFALFAALSSKLSPQARRKTAFKAILYAAIILVMAIVVGQFLLSGLGISLISVQVSGGIILFLFGLQMVFGATPAGDSQEPESGHDMAVFPLAIPSIATPGAIMAVILLTDNDIHPIQIQLGTTLILLAVLGCTLLFMLLATRLMKLIGHNGAAIMVRVMGMILAALSIELVLSALKIIP